MGAHNGGEVARPGSFAPRTLSIVRDLTKQDAALFAKLCQLVWFISEAGFVPIVHNAEAPQFIDAGLNFSALTHLTSIGLIEFNPVTGYGIRHNLKEIAPTYYGEVHQLKSDGGTERRFGIGHTMFTAVGGELLKIADSQGNDEYKKIALDAWKESGWKEDAGEATATDATTNTSS